MLRPHGSGILAAAARGGNRGGRGLGELYKTGSAGDFGASRMYVWWGGWGAGVRPVGADRPVLDE